MLTVITNNVPRDLIYGNELTPSERSKFDYVDDIDAHDFIRYRGEVYDPSEFELTPQNEPARQELNDLSAWSGYQSDSYFSGVVIRYTADFEQVVVGRYFS